MKGPLRLVFMGTPEFSVPSLESLLEDSRYQVVCVYSQPPRPAGRGYHQTPSPVHQCAERYGLEVRTPLTLRVAEEQEKFHNLRADIVVVVAYGLILPSPILESPILGCVNVHASLLPRWRGAAPLQRAIEAGDSETGITLMRMEQGLDTGPMIAKASMPLLPETTISTLQRTLSILGATVLKDNLFSYCEGKIVPVPQPIEGVTYAHKISKDEGRIDWFLPAQTLLRKIHALTPFPGVWFSDGVSRIKIHEASVLLESHKAVPGTVLNSEGYIACGTHILCPSVLQKEGGKPLPAKIFLRGHSLPEGTLLR